MGILDRIVYVLEAILAVNLVTCIVCTFAASVFAARGRNHR